MFGGVPVRCLVNIGRGVIWVAAIALTCCDGRGCDAVEGCGVTPLVEAFPVDERIPNALQMRVSEEGLDFVGENGAELLALAPGGVDIPFPHVTVDRDIPVVGDLEIDICREGGCGLRVVPGESALSATLPNGATLSTEVTVRSVDNAGAVASIPVRLRGGCTFLGCLVNTTCSAIISTREGARLNVGLDVTTSFLEESESARTGYTYLSAPDGSMRAGAGFEDEDIVLNDCTGLSGATVESVMAVLRSETGNLIVGAYEVAARSAVENEQCMTAGEGGCPAGSTADGMGPDAVCRYADSRCVQMLGSDGRANLGMLSLGTLTPAGDAPLQYVLASGGEGEAVNEGLSFFLLGGLLSMTTDFMRSPGHNECVPVVRPPVPPVVARVDAFRSDSIPGAPDGTHVTYGISEAYLDHAGYALFDSGLLCVDPGDALGTVLQTGLVSLIGSASEVLEYPGARVPLGVGLRPQQPLDFVVGTSTEESLLTVILPEAELDFFALPGDDPVRLLTLASDLTLAFDLVSDAGDVGLVLSTVTATRPAVSNSDMLDETAEELAVIVGGAVDALVRDRLGALPSVGLTQLLGFDVEARQMGAVEDGSARFLGVYADLTVPETPVMGEEVDTMMTLGEVTLDATSMAAATFGQGGRNTIPLMLAAMGPDGATFEFSYRVDGGPWSAWATEANPTLGASALWLQGRHTVEARARVAGEPETVDASPAQQEVLIDILAPRVELAEEDGVLTATASDVVTATADLSYRFSIDGAFGDWADSPTATAPTSDEMDRIVEVRDEAGNVGTATIEGTPPPDAGVSMPDAGMGMSDAGAADADGADAGMDASSSGCGCEVAGRGPRNGMPWVFFALAVGCLYGRRRIRR